MNPSGEILEGFLMKSSFHNSKCIYTCNNKGDQMRIVNKNIHHNPYFNENGDMVVPNSTKENLEVAKAMPSRKRFEIISDALSQANLDDDVTFVTAFEALSGYYTIEGE